MPLIVKKAKKTCQTDGCHKKAAPDRRHCYSCKQTRYAELHPIRIAFNITKQNAKRRHKDFELTYTQFELFCMQHGYHINKGRSKESLTIDRIDNSLGYSIDNIQIMTFSANSSKGSRIGDANYFHDVPF